MCATSRLAEVKGFIADLARPFAIYCTTVCAGVTMIVTATKFDKPEPAAAGMFIGAVMAGLGALYGAKAWETAQAAKQSASVQIAQAAGPATPPPGP